MLSNCRQPSAVQQAEGGAGVAAVTPVLAIRTSHGRALMGLLVGVMGRASLTCKLVCI